MFKIIFIFFSIFLPFSISAEVGQIFVFKDLITLDEKLKNSPNAVYIKKGKFIKIDKFNQLIKDFPETEINRNYENNIAVPGFIEHHIHPFLSSLTMNSKIISIDDWDLDGETSKGVLTNSDYISELIKSFNEKGKEEIFITWGYHHYFHGKISRQILDEISSDKPILIIHRSFHEFIMNSAAIDFFGINKIELNKIDEKIRENIDIQEGHFSENGAFLVVPNLMKYFSKNNGFINGLKKTVNYLHQNGITLISNPGSMPDRDLQNAKNYIFGAKTVPFKSYFIPNGMYLSSTFKENLLEKTTEILNWGEGKVQFLPNHIKLFIDGAMYSQNMIMSEGYTDGHQGVWLMEKDKYSEAFEFYWDNNYQIHIHQNGDGGLDYLLDILEKNLKRKPRNDHRTTIVHFGYSRSNQIPRIKELGAIVSANPYYITVLSDLYSKVGVGYSRSQEMVRLGDLEDNKVTFSLHSDMPMAPASPLQLMNSAVNRLNIANKVAGPNQKIEVINALKAVTINAAYILGLEEDYGSISSGKYANITILDKNPLNIDPYSISNIKVIGTIFEGKPFPAEKLIYKMN